MVYFSSYFAFPQPRWEVDNDRLHWTSNLNTHKRVRTKVSKHNCAKMNQKCALDTSCDRRDVGFIGHCYERFYGSTRVEEIFCSTMRISEVKTEPAKPWVKILFLLQVTHVFISSSELIELALYDFMKPRYRLRLLTFWKHYDFTLCIGVFLIICFNLNPRMNK